VGPDSDFFDAAYGGPAQNGAMPNDNLGIGIVGDNGNAFFRVDARRNDTVFSPHNPAGSINF
jgi:hypothetical protein